MNFSYLSLFHLHSIFSRSSTNVSNKHCRKYGCGLKATIYLGITFLRAPCPTSEVHLGSLLTLTYCLGGTWNSQATFHTIGIEQQ